MSEQTARLVERLRARLHRTLRRLTLADAAFGAVLSLGVLAAVWLASVAVEAGFWLGTTPRTALALTIATVSLGVVGVYLAPPLARALGLAPQPSDQEVARKVGDAFPEVSDRLVNLLQLADGERSHAPAPMVDRAVQRLAEDVEPVPFEEVEDFGRARRALRLASLPIVGLVAFLLIAPSTFLDASERLLAPGTHFQKPAPFSLTVAPGNVRLVKGDSLQITVTASGEALPDDVTLEVEADDASRAESIPLEAVRPGVYRHTVAGVRRPIRYRAAADPVESAWYRAEVVARPMVRSLQVRIQPPAYTGLPERSLNANVGDVTGLPGSTVELSAALGGPDVQHASVVFADSTEVPLSIERGRAVGSFRLTNEGSYRIRLESTEGVPNRDPIGYRLALRADARPSIAFLAPEADANLDEDLAARLRLRMSDDYGFSQMRLYWRLSEQRFGEGQSDFQSLSIPISNPRQVDQEVVYDWLLTQDSGLDLMPGDVVTYYVQVWDNDAVAGYKRAQTQEQRLRLPSVSEKYEQLEEEQDAAQDQMERLQQDAESMQKEFQELRDELRRKQDADWEDQRQVEQLQKKQESMQESVEQLSRQMEEVTRRMQEDNLTSPETSEMYQELQRVVEEIDSPELRNALQKLQESMKNLDLRQMQKAMENFEFNEEQYQERLKRALDLFKQLKAQQQLEEMARRTEALEETQERLQEETQKRAEDADETDSSEPDPSEADDSKEGDSSDAEESGATEENADAPSENNSSDGSQSENESPDGKPPEEAPSDGETPDGANEDLAREQERAAEEMRDLMKKMQEMAEEMQEVPQAPQQKMQELNQQMQQQNLPQQMQKNSQQLRQNQMQDAQQGQQQMQQQLSQMRQQMQQMQQGMQGQQKQINLAGLRSALDNTLRLSQDQEALRRTVRELSSESPALREYAQEQEQLSTGVQTVTDSLKKLAQQIPQMTRAVQERSGNALREMDGAVESLSKRSAGRAVGHQKGAMMHLNELALLLSDLLNQMQNSQGSGGGMSMQQMLQQMQQMSGQQQKLNQQIQQMLNDAQGNRLSVDQQKRLQQLADQQRQLKEKLNNLGKGTDLRNQVMGDLDRIAEQMEETIRELQQGRQNRQTLERQRQILTRLLQAQRSLRTQGKEKKREGRQSKDQFERTPPSELTPQEQAEKLRRDLIRALETGYAPDYEELIKRYFELLQKSEK